MAPATKPLKFGEEDGCAALRGHVEGKARQARARYGPEFSASECAALLGDGDFVRFATSIELTETELMPGEFAFAKVSPQAPKGGFALFVHEHFR